MQALAAFMFVCMFVFVSGHGINYCGAKMCGYTNAHTLCQFVDVSPLCVAYLDSALSASEKSLILARLNRRRNDVASGRILGLPSAGNMLKLRWVEELAREAQLWADQCRPPSVPEEHDACRDLCKHYLFPTANSINVGQCVASVVGEAPGMKVESMVDIWFMQNKYYKGNVTYYEPPVANKYFYGDFAQMIWARTFMVGCGRARFMFPVNGRPRSIERLVCNFAPAGPTPYRPLWTASVAATACPSRSRPCRTLTSLCDYQNELNQLSDIDETMTIEDHILLNAVLEMERNETIFQGSLDEIYLTYLAMITMQSPEIVTMSHFNMQKRDIVDRSDIDGAIVQEHYSDYNLDKSHTAKNSTTKVKRRLQTVGRPKAYKIEELSHTETTLKENNDMTEAAMRRKKEFYYDYHNDGFEDNMTLQRTILTTVENEYGLYKTIKVLFNYDENQGIEVNLVAENNTVEDHNTLVRGNEMKPVTLSHEIPDAIKVQNAVNVLKTQWMDINVTEKGYNDSRQALDDYVNDPETARELQAALDRMEHEAANASSTRKTRRQAEDYSDSGNENDISGVTSPDSKYTLIQEVQTNRLEDANISTETPAVLNMMLKYMPYLKTYENEILGNGVRSSAKRICPSIVLMIGALRV